MNKFEIIGRLLVMHNQCENQFSELGKEIDNIINQLISDEESKINPTDIMLLIAKFKMLRNLTDEYNRLLNDIILNGDILFSEEDLKDIGNM